MGSLWVVRKVWASISHRFKQSACHPSSAAGTQVRQHAAKSECLAALQGVEAAAIMVGGARPQRRQPNGRNGMIRSVITLAASISIGTAVTASPVAAQVKLPQTITM